MIEESENIVKKTCRELGISQKELAEIMGVTTRTLTNWSNGTIEIPKLAINYIDMLYMQQEYLNLKNSISASLNIKL